MWANVDPDLCDHMKSLLHMCYVELCVLVILSLLGDSSHEFPQSAQIFLFGLVFFITDMDLYFYHHFFFVWNWNVIRQEYSHFAVYLMAADYRVTPKARATWAMVWTVFSLEYPKLCTTRFISQYLYKFLFMLEAYHYNQQKIIRCFSQVLLSFPTNIIFYNFTNFPVQESICKAITSTYYQCNGINNLE